MPGNGRDDQPSQCPTCKQPVPGSLKVCAKCGNPIDRHHKFVTVAVGRNRYEFHHRVCDDPTNYVDRRGKR